MPIDVILDAVGILYTGVFIAILCGLYGLFVGVLWTPFLVARSVRALFDSLGDRDWRVTYVLWIPLPAVLWGFLFGSVLSLSRAVRPPTRASELYVAGMDGLAVATLVSIILWPILLVYVLPGRGCDWDPNGYGPKTIVLVVGGLVWYLSFLIGPAYVLSILAGFGDVMSGT